MNRKGIIGFSVLLGFSFFTKSQAQVFPGPVGDATTTAIHKTDNRVEYWLSDSVQITRGLKDISDPSLGFAAIGYPQNALGESDPEIISLGDGGQAIYVLSQSISNVNGFDFAVFENAFDNNFLEFAFVEVSTNGTDYVRFPNQCNVDDDEQTGGFGLTNTKDINNLAGKYRGQYGTPFDLSELEDSLSIDVNDINYIKIIDVVGSINPSYASYDTHGNIVNDPWPTPFASSGFDLDAVAVLQYIPLSIDELNNDLSFFENTLTINNPELIGRIQISNLIGKIVFENSEEYRTDLTFLGQGIYFVTLNRNGDKQQLKIKID